MAGGEKIEADRLAAGLLSTTIRLVRRLRVERSEEELSLFKLIVLASLARSGAVTATDLAAREHIRPQSLTRILAFLEKKGFVERQPDGADRRRLLITVTASGMEALRLSDHQRKAWLAGAIGRRLSPAERGELVRACRLLDRLAGDEGGRIKA